MKTILRIFCCLLATLPASAQPYQHYTARRLMDRVQASDTIYIVNFWATWCPPCVKELPAFDTLQQQYTGKPVKVLLVSLDFKEDYEEKLNRFIKKQHPLPEIVWFTETNAEKFIPEIDNRWYGSIPTTLVIHGQKKELFERTIEAGEIGDVVKKWLVDFSSK